MCQLIPFPRPLPYLTESSALCELLLAEAQHEEARNRPCWGKLLSHAEHEYYRHTVERLHEAQAWMRLARDQARYGA